MTSMNSSVHERAPGEPQDASWHTASVRGECCTDLYNRCGEEEEEKVSLEEELKGLSRAFDDSECAATAPSSSPGSPSSRTVSWADQEEGLVALAPTLTFESLKRQNEELQSSTSDHHHHHDLHRHKVQQPLGSAVLHGDEDDKLSEKARDDDILPMKRKTNNNTRIKKAIGWAIALLLLTAAIVAAAIYLSAQFDQYAKDIAFEEWGQGDPDTFPPTPKVTLAPTMSPTSSILFDIPQYSLESMEENPQGPQARAYLWMLKDPFLKNYNESRRRQRFALATLFFSTTDPVTYTGWDRRHKWLSYHDHECEWVSTVQAVRLVDSHSVITPCRFQLPSERKNSLLTAEELEQYEHLLLVDNSLQGSLPAEVALLTALRSIELQQNSLTGTLPSQLGTLSLLEIIRVSNNALTGNIPAELAMAQQLVTLELANNLFTGTLPELQSLEYLSELDITGCTGLIGTIPDEMCRARKDLVVAFDCSDQLCGCDCDCPVI